MLGLSTAPTDTDAFPGNSYGSCNRSVPLVILESQDFDDISRSDHLPRAVQQRADGSPGSGNMDDASTVPESTEESALDYSSGASSGNSVYVSSSVRITDSEITTGQGHLMTRQTDSQPYQLRPVSPLRDHYDSCFWFIAIFALVHATW